MVKYIVKLQTIVLSILLSSVYPGFCQEPLTLQTCFDLAKTHSDSLKARYEQQVQAEEREVQAKGGVLPNLSFNASKVNRDTDAGAYSGESTESRFTVSQPLFYCFSRRSLLTASKLDAQAASFLYRMFYLNVKAEVVNSFYAVIAAQTDLENLKVSQKALEDRNKELSERVRLGKSRDTEVLVIQSQIASLIAQEAQLEGERLKALEELSYLTGADRKSLRVQDDTNEIITPGSLESFLRAASKRPDIQAAKKNIESQAYRVKATKGALWPSLNINGSWYTRRNGSYSESDWETLLSLEVPLYRGGAARAKMGEESSVLRESEARFSQLNKDIVNEITQLYLSLETSIKQTAAYRDAYEKAEKSYQTQIRDYRYGLVNNLDVIQSISTMLDAKMNLDSSLIQVKMNKLLLDIATEN